MLDLPTQIVTLVVCGAGAGFSYAGSIGAREDNEPIFDWILYLLAIGNVYLFLMAGVKLIGFIT